MQSRLLPLVFSLIFPLQSQALDFESYGLGYGILNSGMLSESVSSDGKPGLFGSFTFHFLTAHLRWSGARFKYGLRLGYTVIPRVTADDAADVTQLLFSPQFGVPLGSGHTIWNTSLSFLHTSNKGRGGTRVLQNGNSTATFFIPSDSSSSLLINLETGLEYQFAQNWFVSGDLLFNGLLGDKRNMSLFINVGYSWGTGLSNSGGFNTTPGDYY